MIKKLLIAASLVFILVLIAFSRKNTRDAGGATMLKVEAVPLHSASGWGYEILVDHKLFIYQQWIPAVAGNKEFATKEDAMKTADLAVQKLVHGKPPAITPEDLTALKISH
jgi:Domain of unknown function (DUF4907)